MQEDIKVVKVVVESFKEFCLVMFGRVQIVLNVLIKHLTGYFDFLPFHSYEDGNNAHHPASKTYIKNMNEAGKNDFRASLDSKYSSSLVRYK